MTSRSHPELDQLCKEMQQWLLPRVVVTNSRISAAKTLHPVERSYIANAVESRVLEFETGRFCARHALQQLGVSDSPTIPVGSWREPIWPRGFVGSITHDGGFCVVAVAKKRDHSGIGTDLVDMRHHVEPDVISVVATAMEAERSNEISKDPERIIKMLICAKEATIKIVSPQLRRFVDMTELELHWHKSEFSTRVRCLDGIIKGRVFQQGNFLVSAAQQLPPRTASCTPSVRSPMAQAR